MTGIKLIKSTFYNEKATKRKLADFILKAEFLSIGRECQKFEKKFAQKQKRKFAIMVSSGSMANLVLLQALLNLGRLKRGDRIGISALTWATNAMPIIQLGLIPVAVDCELGTLNVSVEKLEIIKGSKIKALFLTNVLGFCGRIRKIQRWCKENKVLFLEDNCESMGSLSEGELLGNFGLAASFSFFVGHHLSTIEGGMIVTDDKKLFEMLLLARGHGWDRNLSPKAQKQIRQKHNVDSFFARYTFYDLAYNARPTEINGFLGSLQLGFLNEIVKKRQRNFLKFQKVVSNNSDLIHLELKHMDLVSNFAMPVVAKNQKTFQKYKNVFERNQVEIRPIIAGNILRQPFYKKYVRDSSKCPNADFIHKHGFYFPNNPELTPKEINLLCDLISN